MPPKSAPSESRVTLLITLKKLAGDAPHFPPQLCMAFPGVPALSIPLTNTPSRPSSKKAVRKGDAALEEPQAFYIEEVIEKQLELSNPDSLVAPFVQEQLRLSMEEINSKAKAYSSYVTFDVSGLLTTIEFANTFSLSLNGFTFQADLRIVVLKSAHPECRVTRFLSPASLPVFVFKLLTAEALAQSPDKYWRARYLQPVKVECDILGNTYSSDLISQSLLGDERYSAKFAVRLNCTYAAKTQQDVLLLKQQLEEKQVTVRVFCRSVASQAKQDEAKNAPKGAQKGKQKQDVAEPPEYLNFYAFCKFSLKYLLTERLVDCFYNLQPYYEYPDSPYIVTLEKQYVSSIARQPVFVPAAQQFDAKGKPMTSYQARQTDFASYYRDAETMPLGDWSHALVHVVAAVYQPLNDFQIGASDSRTESANSLRRQKSLAAAEDMQLSVKKPQFTHFERMYVYLNPKQNEILKQVLTHIGLHNVRFILAFADPSFKRQFEDDAVDDLEKYVGLLSTTGLKDAIKDSDMYNYDLGYISGYRFVDRHIQMLYLEAPARFDVFSSLRLMLDKTHTIYKAAPAAVFRKRIFGESPFFLQHFALCKSILRLSMQNDQENALLTRFMGLFNVTQNKLFPLEPIKFDLRAYQQADLFFDYQFVQQLLRFFAGNIPKNCDSSTLFARHNDADSPGSPRKTTENGSPSLYSFAKDSVSNSPESPSRSPTKQDAKLSQMLRIRHPALSEYPERIPIPYNEFTADSRMQNRTSSKQLPQFEIKRIDNLLGTSADFQKQSARENKILEEVAQEITDTSQLKGQSIVRDVLDGKRVFLYSSQRLNKFAVQSHILAKVCGKKNTAVDIEVPAVRKHDTMYERERYWK